MMKRPLLALATLAVAALSFVAVPRATPAQQLVDDGPVFCADDSHCSHCRGTCAAGGYCLC